jgi:putative flippase GtrA
VTDLLARASADRRVRYLFSGGVSAVVYYVSFSTGWLVSDGRVPYLLLALMANILTAVLTFPLYRKAFGGYEGRWLAAFARFYVICFWSLLVVLGGLPLLVEVFGVPVLVAQAVIIVVSPLVNYQLMRLWAFRSRARSRVAPGRSGRRS